MDLGTFSISLAVKDLRASRAFYEKLGFEVVGGDDEKWAILRNGDAVIGLFEGLFERNIITFNPADARAVQTELKGRGLELEQECDEEGEGPAHLVLLDPDGNPILIDQH